jgi:hypothetical protein
MPSISTIHGHQIDPADIVRIEFHPAPMSLVGEEARIFWSTAVGQQFSSVQAISELGKLRALISDAAAGFNQVSMANDSPEAYSRTA